MAHTSWKTIAADISRQIETGELAIGERVPSGETLALKWSVSRHTAHRAIEELQRQGLVVRQRRWGTVVAEKSAPRKGRVAFLVDNFAQVYNFPSGDLIRGMQDSLGAEMDLVIAECKGDPEIEIRQIRKFQDSVDGLIIYPTTHPKSTPVLQKLIAGGLPTVVLDRIPEGIHANAVVSDNEGATLKAIRALEERGHRRIGFFSFHKPDFSSVSERHHAYQSALDEVGVEDTSQFTRWFMTEVEGNSQFFAQSICDALFTLVKQKDPITALFCVQDSLAAAALQACDQLGINMPEELEIATFNDWPPMMLRTPWCVHRIVQRSYDIGKIAADLLLEQVNGVQKDPRVVRVAADFFIADAGLQPAKTQLRFQ